ncbi:hypothetical protein FHS78_000458 [Parvibaculum indicum]|nr:hypothetical protein [Parvibaculum indicum]
MFSVGLRILTAAGPVSGMEPPARHGICIQVGTVSRRGPKRPETGRLKVQE